MLSEIASLSPRRQRRGSTLPGALSVAGAALLWSTLGIFYRYLSREGGMSPLSIAFARAAGGGIVLAAFLVLKRPRDLIVAAADLPGFALGGFASVTLFYFFYIEAVRRTPIAVAVVLLYTAPAWIALFSWVFWGESLSRSRAAALLLAAAGTALVAGLFSMQERQLDPVGIFFGFAAGLTYALYSIYGAWASGRYETGTVVVYAMLFGALFLLPWQSPGSLAPVFHSPSVLLCLAALVAGPTIGAYALYTRGLARAGASSASLIATLEPLFAAILAAVLLHEIPPPQQALGGVLILLALLLLGRRHDPKGSGIARLN